MKHISMFARRAAALLLAAVLLVGAIPPAFAEEEGTPEGEAVTEAVYTVPTTIGGADTTLLPAEEETPELAVRLERYHYHALPEYQGQGPAPECETQPGGLPGGHYLHRAGFHRQLCERLGGHRKPGKPRLWPFTPTWNTTKSTALRPMR